jgi:hypothetical protein
LTHAELEAVRPQVAPLTWGQRAMWRSMRDFTSPHTVVNLCRVLAVPARAVADLPTVTRAVGALIGRHSSLRTRIEEHAGVLTQVISTERLLPINIEAADADDPDGARTAQEAARRWGDPPFDHGAEWPLRVTLVATGDRVRQIVLVFSHSTVDFHATELVLRDLRLLLLRGPIAAPATWQSLEVARREREFEEPRSRRAIGYWVEQFHRGPHGTFDTMAPAPGIRRGQLTSAAAETATRALAARHRASPSTVLLTAIATVLANDTHSPTGVVTMANNRYRAGYSDAVAKLNQFGFCRLDLGAGASFPDRLRATFRATLSAYRHAYYDPAAWEETFTDLGHDHNMVLASYLYFNDIRLPREIAIDDPVPDRADYAALRERTTFDWLSTPGRSPFRCRIQVVDAPGAVGLVITVNTPYVSTAQAEALLRDVERVLVEAALA